MGDAGGERQLDRYVLFGEFASGGMASVHFGRLRGPVGFSRTVAIKKLLPQYARDPEFVAMFIDEARLAARVRHPNVATIADVIAAENELFLVMDYLHGESAADLQRAARRLHTPMPPRIAAGILLGALHGLHAAHIATSDGGAPLGIVHRDVSPENILVGVDGISRVLDFGIAFAVGRAQITREGHIKGKLKYTAPELLEGKEATPLVDVYSAGVVLWELMVGRRLFTGDNEARILMDILRGEIPAPSQLASGLPAVLDTIVRRATARDPAARYASADDFARDVEERLDPASARDIGAWVSRVAKDSLASRAAVLASIEGAPSSSPQPSAAPVKAPPNDDELPTEIDSLRRLPQANDPTLVTARVVVTQEIEPASSPPSAKKSPRRVVALIALPVIVATIAVVAFAGRQEKAATPTPEATAPPRSASPTVPLPDSPATAPTAADTSTTTTDITSATPTKPRPPDRPKTTSSGCNPPYTVDARGIHHFKPSCM